MDFDYWKICKSCGKCCHTPYFWFVTDKEIDKIKKLGCKDFYKENKLKSESRHCMFFKDNKCSIYNSRPMDCQRYPVMHFFDHGKPSFMLDLECPAALEIPKTEINRVIEKSRNFLKSMNEIEYTDFKKQYMKAMKSAFDFE